MKKAVLELEQGDLAILEEMFDVYLRARGMQGFANVARLHAKLVEALRGAQRTNLREIPTLQGEPGSTGEGSE